MPHRGLKKPLDALLIKCNPQTQYTSCLKVALTSIEYPTMSVIVSEVRRNEGHLPPSFNVPVTKLTTPSSYPTKPTPLSSLPGKLPHLSSPLSPDLYPASIARSIISTLPNLTPSLLRPDAIWRDLLSLSVTLRTFHPLPLSWIIGMCWPRTDKLEISSWLKEVPELSKSQQHFHQTDGQRGSVHISDSSWRKMA